MTTEQSAREPRQTLPTDPEPATAAGGAAREPRDTYNAIEIEPRWQQRWEEIGLHKTDLENDPRPPYYLVTMYPYPSGDLHIGHWFIVTPTDAIGRFQTMQGNNVFFPVGFDAFGLPAENAAIKNGVHPRDWTYKNIENMRRQFRSMGARFDWDKELVTADPSYYKWNQWFFLKFMENGLAYRQMAPVDWCPKDQVVLAREQVLGTDRVCWRCGTQVIKRDLEQWFFRTTAYADELLNYDGLEYPTPIKVMQTNWIGRSEGAELTFEVAADDTTQGHEIKVFTTRPDTLFGATFMVLAPEHPLVDELTTGDQRAAVDEYRYEARRKSEIDRLTTDREKTGVPIGAHAINPISGESVPIWVADYVLMGYGTGAIMAVPAHDERDFAFAQRFGLPIRQVVAARGAEPQPQMSEAYSAHSSDEVLVNSGDFSGMHAQEGGRAIVSKLEQAGKGESAVTYRLRDWLVGRQRGWGAPIPVVYCEADPSCGIVPVPYEQLPVELPLDIDKWPAQGNPLESHEAFLHTPCPKCGGPGRRETDTMDTFVDSGWYWWRYLSVDKEDGPIDRRMDEIWCPVQSYTGGAEHAVLHLMYARFFAKALNDLGLVHEREPWKRLFNQGQILGADGERMSKSRGNVQDPDELVSRYGADTVRLFLMFMGPWDQGGPWSPTGIDGIHRFLRRVWTVTTDPRGRENGDPESGRLPAGETAGSAADGLRRLAHRAVKKVTEDHADYHWNTMISELMGLTNRLIRLRGTDAVDEPQWDEAVDLLLLMLAPIAPHISEELWSRRLAGRGEPWASIHVHPWPRYDETLIVDTEVELPIQVNGKLRDIVSVPTNLSEVEIEQIVMSRDKVQAQIEGQQVVRIIQIPNRLVNVVTRPLN